MNERNKTLDAMLEWAFEDDEDEPSEREITTGVREVPDQHQAHERGVKERESLAPVSRSEGLCDLCGRPMNAGDVFHLWDWYAHAACAREFLR